MPLKKIDHVKKGLAHWCAAEPPCIWGKWPSHGDYIRHNVTHEQAEYWMKWTSAYWYRKPSTLNSPIAFILPPHLTAFSGDFFVHGVIVESWDKVGRDCPLVVFQKLTHWQMSRLLSLPSAESGVVHGQDMLYWWSRLMRGVEPESFDFPRLVGVLDRVWRIFEPGLLDVLGTPTKGPDVRALETLLQEVSALSDKNQDEPSPKGVKYLPWADWPDRVLRDNHSGPAYWMQDVHGGYLCASDDVMKLWGVRV